MGTLCHLKQKIGFNKVKLHDRYNILRYELFNEVRSKCNSIDYVEPEYKVKILMSEEFLKFTIKFTYDSFILRKGLT